MLQRVLVGALLVLCAALILPRVLRKDLNPDQDQESGRFPPMMHRSLAPDLRAQRSPGVRGHAEVRGTGSGGAGTGSGGAGTGSGPGGKSNLAAQIIPVYGFGILLYILYILFKITSKGHSKPTPSRLSLRSENNKRKITDFELSQLQERLRETELVMEELVSNGFQEEDSPLSVSLDQEQSLLLQLTEITRAMKTNRLVQDFTKEAEPEEAEPDLLDSEQIWSRCSCNCGEHPQEPSPTNPEETSPTNPEETSPTNPEETSPTNPEETSPINQEETSPTNQEEQSPNQEEKSLIKKPETSSRNQEETAPKNQEEAIPNQEERCPTNQEETSQNQEETSPINQEERSPVNQEEASLEDQESQGADPGVEHTLRLVSSPAVVEEEGEAVPEDQETPDDREQVQPEQDSPEEGGEKEGGSERSNVLVEDGQRGEVQPRFALEEKDMQEVGRSLEPGEGTTEEPEETRSELSEAGSEAGTGLQEKPGRPRREGGNNAVERETKGEPRQTETDLKPRAGDGLPLEEEEEVEETRCPERAEVLLKEADETMGKRGETEPGLEPASRERLHPEEGRKKPAEQDRFKVQVKDRHKTMEEPRRTETDLKSRAGGRLPLEEEEEKPAEGQTEAEHLLKEGEETMGKQRETESELEPTAEEKLLPKVLEVVDERGDEELEQSQRSAGGEEQEVGAEPREERRNLDQQTEAKEASLQQEQSCGSANYGQTKAEKIPTKEETQEEEVERAGPGRGEAAQRRRNRRRRRR